MSYSKQETNITENGVYTVLLASNSGTALVKGEGVFDGALVDIGYLKSDGDFTPFSSGWGVPFSTTFNQTVICGYSEHVCVSVSKATENTNIKITASDVR